jgi:hypothetical protein
MKRVNGQAIGAIEQRTTRPEKLRRVSAGFQRAQVRRLPEMLRIVLPALAACAFALPIGALAQTTSTGKSTTPTSPAEQQEMHRGKPSTSGSANSPSTMPSGDTRGSSATSPSAQSDTSATATDTTTTKSTKKSHKRGSHTNTMTNQTDQTAPTPK